MEKKKSGSFKERVSEVLSSFEKIKGAVEDIPPMKRLPMVNGDGC